MVHLASWVILMGGWGLGGLTSRAGEVSVMPTEDCPQAKCRLSRLLFRYNIVQFPALILNKKLH